MVKDGGFAERIRPINSKIGHRMRQGDPLVMLSLGEINNIVNNISGSNSAYASLWLQARPLKTLELSDEKISPLIAARMASVHGMNVPINKEPRWLWDTTSRSVQFITQDLAL